MTGRHVIVYLDSSRGARDAIAAEIGPEVVVEWVPGSAALDGLLDDPEQAVEALVIGADVEFEAGLRTAERLGASHPDLGVILLTGGIETVELRRAIRAGVLDVLDAGRAPGELREAIDRSRARYVQLHAQSEGFSEGRLVLVFSTKGGSGTSVVASNLAVALADHLRQEVGLVDLSLTSGDLAIMLQLLPAWSVSDAAGQGPRLDHVALRGYLTPHQSGVHLLAAPVDPTEAEKVSTESIHHLLTLMRAVYPVTVIDTPSYFSDQLLAAIDVVDEIIVVGSLDVPSIKNLKLALETLEALHFGRDRIRIVLNRVDSAVGLKPSEVERSLGTEVDITMPSTKDVPISVNQGAPLYLTKRRSGVSTAMGRLAEDIAKRYRLIAPEATTQRRRLLGRR